MNPTVTEALPILCLVVVGFFLKKTDLLKKADGSLLSRMILNITLPSVIFLSISQAKIEPLELLVLAASGLAIAVCLRMIGGRVASVLKLDDPTAGVFILGCMVMNIGTLMIPVVGTVFGPGAVSRTAAFDVGNSVMASGYGYYVATQYGSKNPQGLTSGIRRVLSVPVLWAIVLGLIINLAGLTIPGFFSKLLTPLSQANAPLAMLALGIFVSFKFSKWKLMSLAVFLRMGVGLLIGQLIILLTQMQGLDRMVVTLASAMPIGMIPLAYAATEGLDTEFAASCISFSIIVGMITTPLLLTSL